VASLRHFLFLYVERDGVIRTLSPNNYGDLPLHLTYIAYFVKGARFWPANPIFTGESLHYPFGVDLFKVDQATDLAVSDLTPDYRSRVRDGIEAMDSDDAARILSTLRDHRLPLCRPAGKEEPTPTTGASPSTALPPGTLPSDTAATVPGFPPPTTETTTAAPTTRTSSAEPGVNCREGN